MKLTKQSKELIMFFYKNRNNYNPLTDLRMTKSTKSILTELYNYILKAYNFSYTLQFEKTIKKITNKNIIKPKFFNFKSFPKSIITHIENYSVKEVLYSFSLEDRDIKVYFVLENDNDISHLDKYIKIVSMWLYMLNIYGLKKCSKTIAIYFYFTSLQKILPSIKSHVLDETNVNTAFTTACPVDSEIVVFRKEEWFKVFIHETFHNFGLDFCMMNMDAVNKCILNIYDVKSDVNVYESYTEFWAEIINACFCGFLQMKNEEDIDEFLSNTEIYINLERIYSLFQLTKTLDYMGLEYSDLYLKTKEHKEKRHQFYKENTNVLSYYIIKCVLINNYQLFLYWCRENNKLLLNFNKTHGNLQLFCKFIEKHYKSSSLLVGINKTHNFLSQIIEKKGYKFLKTNMRMSICELG